MEVIINSDSGNQSLKSGEMYILFVVSDRRKDKCVSGSAMVGGEAYQPRGTIQRSVLTWYYDLLCPSRTGVQLTPSVAKVDSKREVGMNSEEVKWI